MIHATISPIPGPGCPAATVWRDQTANSPAAQAIAEPASATQASAQRRVISASIEKPTPNTSANQANTRDGRATAAAPAPWLLNSTSHPRTSPVCGRMNDPSSTNTRIGDDEGPCARVDLARDPAFGGLDLGPEGVECRRVLLHRAHPRGSSRLDGRPDAGHAKTDTARALPGGVRVTGAGAAVGQDARVGDEVVRRGLGDHRGDDVAGPHLLSFAVKCTSRPSRARPVMRAVRASLRPSPVATSSSTVWPISARLPSSEICSCSVDQPLIAFLHNGFRQLPVQFGGGGAGPLGVLEGERRREPGLPHHVEGGGEVLFGLAGKSDDQVGGDGRVRHGRPNPVDDAQVALGAVRPPHRAQHPVGSRLQRHVQGRTDVRRLRHRLDDVVGELGRMRRGEPHAFQPVDASAGPQQLGEGAAIAGLAPGRRRRRRRR